MLHFTSNFHPFVIIKYTRVIVEKLTLTKIQNYNYCIFISVLLVLNYCFYSENIYLTHFEDEQVHDHKGNINDPRDSAPKRNKLLSAFSSVL